MTSVSEIRLFPCARWSPLSANSSARLATSYARFDAFHAAGAIPAPSIALSISSETIPRRSCSASFIGVANGSMFPRSP